MRVLVAVLAASVLAPACGQGQGTEVLAPFVSRLKARVEGGAIVLSWQDSADARGPVSVYRHTEEITPETLGSAQKVAEVPYGTGSCTDRPPDKQPYFYAALASDAQGQPYQVLVAFRNKTLLAVAVEAIGGPESAAAAEGPAGPAPAASAAPQAAASAPVTGVATPAAAQPDIQTTVDAPAAPAGGLAAAAAPAPDVQAPGVAAVAIEATARLRPLPYLVLQRGVYSGEDLAPSQAMPQRRQLGSEAEEAVAGLLAGFDAPPRQPMRPAVFGIDLAEGDGGEQSLLRSIIREAAESGDSRAAEQKLRSFLGVSRDAALEARGRFYLAQALYFQRRTAEALVEMLPALDLYRAETRPWVDRCLDELAGIR